MNSAIENQKFLFQQISDKKAQGPEPFVLFLGAGASLNSGCPSMMEIVKDTITKFGKRNADVIQNENELFGEFFQIMKEFSETDRHLLLNRLFDDSNPSTGYRYLASLIEAGYFKYIFTTNYDNLLEKSLQIAGLHFPDDFTVLIAGKDKDETIKRQLEWPHPQIKIIKLHGDLIAGNYIFTPEESTDFPPKIRSCFKKYLQKELITIGYRMTDQDVLKCLADATKKSNRLWYINPQPANENLVKLLKKRKIRSISDENGKFDNFMQDLSIFLKLEDTSIPSSDYQQILLPIFRQFKELTNKIDQTNQKINEKLELLNQQFSEFFSIHTTKKSREELQQVTYKDYLSDYSEAERLSALKFELKQLNRKLEIAKTDSIKKNISTRIKNIEEELEKLKKI